MDNLSRQEKIELLRKAAVGSLTKFDFLHGDQDEVWMNLDGKEFINVSSGRSITLTQMDSYRIKSKFSEVTIDFAR